MSKKNTGLLIAFGAALGAAAACVSYYLKYKSFSDELDKDFHDYEDEDECGTEDEKKCSASSDAAKRNYITIDSCKSKCQEGEDSHAEQATEPMAKEPQTEETVEKTPEKTAVDVTIEEDTEGTKE